MLQVASSHSQGYVTPYQDRSRRRRISTHNGCRCHAVQRCASSLPRRCAQRIQISSNLHMAPRTTHISPHGGGRIAGLITADKHPLIPIRAPLVHVARQDK